MTPGRAGSASPRRVVLQTPRKGPRARSEEHPTQAANATRRGKGDCGRAGAVGAFYPRGSLAPCVRKPPVRQRMRPPCKRPNRRPGKERGDPAGKRLIAGPERAASEKRPLRAKSRGPVRFTSPVIPRPTAGGTRLLALQDRRDQTAMFPRTSTPVTFAKVRTNVSNHRLVRDRQLDNRCGRRHAVGQGADGKPPRDGTPRMTKSPRP